MIMAPVVVKRCQSLDGSVVCVNECPQFIIGRKSNHTAKQGWFQHVQAFWARADWRGALRDVQVTRWTGFVLFDTVQC
jgi:hypothetical protein